MKKDASILKMVLSGAAGIALLTGCAHNDSQYGSFRPSSRLAFSPVTETEQLVKWSGQFPKIRSIESYAFYAPMDSGRATFVETAPPESPFLEPAGAEPVGYGVIIHTPNQR